MLSFLLLSTTAPHTVPWHFTQFQTDICPSYQGPEKKSVSKLSICCELFTIPTGVGIVQILYSCIGPSFILKWTMDVLFMELHVNPMSLCWFLFKIKV